MKTSMKTRGIYCMVIALFWTACATSQVYAQTKLRLGWGETDPKSTKFIKEVVVEYKGKTGVEVVPEVLPGEELWTKLQLSISTGRPYDLATNGNHIWTYFLVDKGQLEPVDDIIAEYPKNDFLPGCRVNIKGKDWWVPYDYNPFVLYYREDLLKQKGLTIPKNWDELLRVAKAMTEGDRYGIALCMGEINCNDFGMTPFLWAHGVELFDKNWNVILDSPKIKPKAVEVLNYFKELHKYMPPGIEQSGFGDMLSLFATGRVAITEYAGRLVHYMADKAPDLLDKFQVGGYPTKDGKRFSGGNAIDGFVIPKGPNSKAAKEFMRWFTKNKMAEFDACLAVHFMPAQKSVLNDPRYRNDEFAKRFWDRFIKIGYDLIQDKALSGIRDQGPHMDARPNMVFESGIIRDMIQKVITMGTPPEKAVDEAAKQIRELIKK